MNDSSRSAPETPAAPAASTPSGSQTLLRGLDVLEAVADGPIPLIELAPRLGLQLMVKDYIGKFDAQEATSINVNTKTTHNWAVSAGLRLGL